MYLINDIRMVSENENIPTDFFPQILILIIFDNY